MKMWFKPQCVCVLCGFIITDSLVFLRWYEPEMPDCVRQRCSSSDEICPSCHELRKKTKGREIQKVTVGRENDAEISINTPVFTVVMLVHQTR